MPPTACPTCIADAPIEVAWSLFDPARLDAWWDAKTRRVRPEGPLAPGQRIEAVTGPLGMFVVTADGRRAMGNASIKHPRRSRCRHERS